MDHRTDHALLYTNVCFSRRLLTGSYPIYVLDVGGWLLAKGNFLLVPTPTFLDFWLVFAWWEVVSVMGGFCHAHCDIAIWNGMKFEFESFPILADNFLMRKWVPVCNFNLPAYSCASLVTYHLTERLNGYFAQLASNFNLRIAFGIRIVDSLSPQVLSSAEHRFYLREKNS